MIRGYEEFDREQIIEILRNGLELDMSYIENDLSDINSKVMVYDDNGIKGFILLTPRNTVTKFWNIDIYVNPEDRKKGIGSRLYNEGYKFLQNENTNTTSTKYVENNDYNSNFYKGLGYRSWFSYYEMRYEGEHKTEDNIKFISYEDKYYEKYVKLISEGFYELRKANDIQPYVCYIPSEEDRKVLLNDRSNIYISVDDNDDIICTVLINNGYIDELVVNKKYEGRGLGKATTKFAINKCFSSGLEKISLDVVTWNTKAINIYKELGFKIVQKVNMLRQFFDNEEWQ